MQITVVEDDARFAGDVIRTLTEFFSREGVTAQIRYQEGTGLLEELEKGQCCDLCLLDVEMPGMDGITLAEKIRARDENIRIVFLTSYEKYAFPSYKVRGDGYVLKENYRKELLPVLQRICREEQKKREEYYVIQTDTQGYRIRIRDMICLDKDKKYVVFRCMDKKEYRERDTLENVLGRLPQEQFALIDKGMAVNLGQ